MKALSKILLSGLTAAALLGMAGCATESNRALPVEKVASAGVVYNGVRVPIAVGKFDNRSSYMRGIFSDGVDRLGGQAKTILITHLQQTNRFSVLDRDNMGEISQEAAIKGALGGIHHFGRADVDDVQRDFGVGHLGLATAENAKQLAVAAFKQANAILLTVQVVLQ